MKPVFIIEHFGKEFFEWSLIEYSHISEIVGRNNLIITNAGKHVAPRLNDIYKVQNKGVESLKLSNICLLDANAGKSLAPSDSGKFHYFLFGGILGDDPPQNRTRELIERLKLKRIKFEARNLGKEQMPTDTAVYAAKKIIEGTPLKQINFRDGIEVEISDNESVVLPYRYALDDKGMPVLSRKLVDYLKKKEGF